MPRPTVSSTATKVAPERSVGPVRRSAAAALQSPGPTSPELTCQSTRVQSLMTRQHSSRKESSLADLDIAIILGSTRPGRNGEGRRPLGVRPGRAADGDARSTWSTCSTTTCRTSTSRCRRHRASTAASTRKAWADDDRLVRRLRLRHARVQPLHLRRAEERHRLPLRGVEQQGRRLRQLRLGRRRPRRGAPAPRDGRAAGRRRPAAGPASRCSPDFENYSRFTPQPARR